MNWLQLPKLSVMLKHLLANTIFLTCSVVVFGSSPFRGSCKREAQFKKSVNESALSNHVISTIDVTSVQDCTLACLGHTQCISCNYQITDLPTKKCELNAQSKVSKPSDYVNKPGYSYYDANDFVLSVCSSSPCRNGGSCVDVCKGTFVCKCLEGYIGERCNDWIGQNGSSAKFPGRTCSYIKRHWKGLESGRYWIDIMNSGLPKEVYCDMKTDGGGWMLVKSFTLPLVPDSILKNPNFIEYNTYEKIGTLESYEWINDAGLLALKNDLNFSQLRFYCYMSSVGRVFHVKTDNNENGYKVVRFFVESTSPIVPPCNTFTPLPDDNSALSRNCDKWGATDSLGAVTNLWGIPGSFGTMRPYTGIAMMTGHVVRFGNGVKSCDGSTTDVGSTGDTWKLFVR